MQLYRDFRLYREHYLVKNWENILHISCQITQAEKCVVDFTDKPYSLLFGNVWKGTIYSVQQSACMVYSKENTVYSREYTVYTIGNIRYVL